MRIIIIIYSDLNIIIIIVVVVVVVVPRDTIYLRWKGVLQVYYYYGALPSYGCRSVDGPLSPEQSVSSGDKKTIRDEYYRAENPARRARLRGP